MNTLTDTSAERAVLAAAMRGKAEAQEIFARVKPEHFAESEHRTIYAAINEVRGQGHEPDFAAVTQRLRATSRLEGVGGVAFVTDVGTFPVVSPDSQIARVLDLHKARAAVQAFNRAAEDIKDNPTAVNEILERQSSFLSGVMSTSSKPGVLHVGEVAQDMFAEFERRKEAGKPPGLYTGFVGVDRVFMPRSGQLIIVAARPAMGKTTYCLQAAYEVARQGHGVGVFSFEMEPDELTERLFSIESQVYGSKLRSGELSERDWHAITKSLSQFSDLPLYLGDVWDATVAMIGAELHRLKLRLAAEGRELKLAVIDYMQLMHAGKGKRSENRTVEVSEISRGLKLLARELGICIIALSQLSRAVEARPNKRPMLSDLRESGSIEQDANVVGFLYRDDYYNPESCDRGIAEFLVAKNRGGEAPVTVRLGWRASTTTFYELDNAPQLSERYSLEETGEVCGLCMQPINDCDCARTGKR